MEINCTVKEFGTIVRGCENCQRNTACTKCPFCDICESGIEDFVTTIHNSKEEN